MAVPVVHLRRRDRRPTRKQVTEVGHQAGIVSQARVPGGVRSSQEQGEVVDRAQQAARSHSEGGGDHQPESPTVPQLHHGPTAEQRDPAHGRERERETYESPTGEEHTGYENRGAFLDEAVPQPRDQGESPQRGLPAGRSPYEEEAGARRGQGRSGGPPARSPASPQREHHSQRQHREEQGAQQGGR